MILEIKNLVKRYGDLIAVDHLNLQVNEGEIFGLLGPNGSGKTTTINCILSLLKYNKGTITIFGKEMKPSAYDIKKDLGVIMQNVAVFSELTVYQNIDYFCSLYISDKEIRKKYVEDAINFVGLQDYKKFVPKKLSGGLLRRLNIACGIAHKPKLIILDEPTVAVDPQSRNNILEGIKKLNEQGATIIYTTHYMEEVEELCSKIVILDKGKIIAQGTKEQLKEMISQGEKITVEVYNINKNQIEELKKIKNVSDVSYIENTLIVKTNTKTSILPVLIDFINTNHLSYGAIYSQLPTLNDVFLELTGKELRD